MTAFKTDDNQGETPSNHEVLLKHLEHLDAMLHRADRRLASIEAFIDEHRPALARGLALMDPGASVRKFMGGRKGRAVPQGEQGQVPQS